MVELVNYSILRWPGHVMKMIDSYFERICECKIKGEDVGETTREMDLQSAWSLESWQIWD